MYSTIFRCISVFESHISMRMGGEQFRVSHGTVPCVPLLTASFCKVMQGMSRSSVSV